MLYMTDADDRTVYQGQRLPRLPFSLVRLKADLAGQIRLSAQLLHAVRFGSAGSSRRMRWMMPTSANDSQSRELGEEEKALNAMGGQGHVNTAPYQPQQPMPVHQKA